MNAALRPLLYGLFAVSGFCGLIYESIWSHYLRNYLGHAAHGQTVVLVIFVGGLALGAWLAARRTERLAEPLLAYAAAEIFIGLFAFVFHPLFVGFTGWAYDTLLPAACGQSGWCATQWLTAALLIAAPAIALGATFPWMVAGVLRRYPQAPGHEISVLYFLNSLGAVFGVLASAFVFIPALGLPGTVMLAGALNIAIGIAVFAIARSTRVRAAAAATPVSIVPDVAVPAKGKAAKRVAAASIEPAAVSPQRPRDTPARSLVVTFLVIAALTGLSSFVYEIVWIRMLSLVLGSSTHAFELMLAAFILGLASGGAWIRNRIDRIPDTRSFLGHVQVLMGLAALLTLPLYGSLFEAFAFLLRGLARTEPGYALYHVISAAIALAVMLPATFLAGMTLPLITYRLLDAGVGERAIGNVYAVNTFGAILGVIAAVHVLVPTIGLKGALLFGAAVDILLGVYLLRRARGELAFSWPAYATVIVGLAAFGLVAAGVRMDPLRMAAGVYRDGVARLAPEASKVRYYADGKTASVSVIETPTTLLLRTNGKTDASLALPGNAPTSDEPTQALLAALALGANPQAKRAAVIGLGSGITSAALLATPVLQRVDTIEIERRMADGAKLLGERNAKTWSDERSHFVFDDAKAWLARSSAPFDIVASEPSNPWVSGVASLFTAETYERIAKHLAPGGILAQWIQVYEMDGALLSSIFRALGTHFPHYVVYKSGPGDLIVLASRERVPRVDTEWLFKHRELAALLKASGVASPADIDGRWRGDNRVYDALLAAYAAPMNSDYRPYVDQNAARTRFVMSTFPLFDVNLGPSALLEVLGVQVPASRGSEDTLAAALAATLVGPLSGSALPEQHAGYADALRATRELFITCKPGGPVPVLLEGAVGTAMAINELTAERARAVWGAIRENACYRTLDARLKVWVDLFAAVGARDAANMSDLGARAAETAPNPFSRDYALGAAAAAEIALKRPEVAGRLLQLYSFSQESPWTSFLREASAGKSIATK